MKIKGNDLIVFFRQEDEWKTLAFATTCELDVQADTIAVSSRTGGGRWLRQKKKRFSWSVRTGHLLSGETQAVDVAGLLLSDEEVFVSLSSVEPHPLPVTPDEYRLDGRCMMAGSALLTRMTVTGNRGDWVQMSVELSGSGPLDIRDYAEIVMKTEETLHGSEGALYLGRDQRT